MICALSAEFLIHADSSFSRFGRLAGSQLAEPDALRDPVLLIFRALAYFAGLPEGRRYKKRTGDNSQ